ETASSGSPTRRTSAGLRTSTACRPCRDRSRTSAARVCCACWGTASPPITSRPPARSARRVRPESIWWSTPSYSRTSTRTARGVAILRLLLRLEQPAAPLVATVKETNDVPGLAGTQAGGFPGGKGLTVQAAGAGGAPVELRGMVRIGTPQGLVNYRHRGMLE